MNLETYGSLGVIIQVVVNKEAWQQFILVHQGSETKIENIGKITIENNQGWGIQKGCPYQNFSKCKCVKQVHCLNKIKYDFTKCTFNLLYL